jgi:hypothetical protein
MDEKQLYLGDGAYVEVTLFGELRLFTSNGVEEKNSVVLEGGPADLLAAFIQAHRGALVG